MHRDTFAEGKGLDILDCDNGKIRFHSTTKGKISRLYPKNGFTKRESDFLNRFEEGMVYTCGLDGLGWRIGYEMIGTLHNILA